MTMVFIIIYRQFVKKKSDFQKKKKIIFWDFFDEFKDLWKIKGAYFLKTCAAGSQKPLICRIGH